MTLPSRKDGSTLFNGAELRRTLVGLAPNPTGTLTIIPWRPFSPSVLSSLDKRVIIAPNPGGVDQPWWDLEQLTKPLTSAILISTVDARPDASITHFMGGSTSVL